MEQEIARNLDTVLDLLEVAMLIGGGLFGLLLRAIVEQGGTLMPVDFSPLRGVLTFLSAEFLAAFGVTGIIGLLFGDAAFASDNLHQWSHFAVAFVALVGFVMAYYQFAPSDQ